MTSIDEPQLRRAWSRPTIRRRLHRLMMLGLVLALTWTAAANDFAVTASDQADRRAVGRVDGARVRTVADGVISPARNPAPPTEDLLRVDKATVFTVHLGWHLFFYFATAGAAYLGFHVMGKRWLAARRIQPRAPARAAIRRDIFYSLSSAIVFALVGVLSAQLIWHGWTKIYLRVDRYGWGYFWFSLLAMIVLHDTWFYWTHRLMHWPRLFPLMHRVHHLSHTPSPWSALAFHPTEAVVQAIIFPLAALLLPLHPFVALLWLIYMIVINVWGHLGFELLPAGFRRHWLFRWHNTTTHHDMHHRHVTGNYSLYFNFWDRVMRTNHRDY